MWTRIVSIDFHQLIEAIDLLLSIILIISIALRWSILIEWARRVSVEDNASNKSTISSSNYAFMR